jgi:hypothetical protein
VDSAGTADAPPRRRASWSLKAIVENVAGKPIGEFQDPGKAPHPYVRASLEAARAPSASSEGSEAAEEEPYDPVGHVYPPLVGAHGRAYHGPENEHHAETLERHRGERATGPGQIPPTPGPSHRPERLYLHYLLLHMDRLDDSALQYLRVAVEEEVAHRLRPLAPPPLPPARDPVPAA